METRMKTACMTLGVVSCAAALVGCDFLPADVSAQKSAEARIRAVDVQSCAHQDVVNRIIDDTRPPPMDSHAGNHDPEFVTVEDIFNAQNQMKDPELVNVTPLRDRSRNGQVTCEARYAV